MRNRPMAALIRRLRVTAAAAEAIPTGSDIGLRLQLEALSAALQAQARSFERHVPEAEIVQPAASQAACEAEAAA